MNRNVINLGIVSSDIILSAGIKGKYYIYYKSDNILYLYDSYRDVEWNLFDLQVPITGTLSIYTTRTLAEIPVLHQGWLNISTTKTTRTIEPSGSHNGWLHISTLKDLRAGTITLTIVDDVVPDVGILTITANRILATGSIKITIVDDYLYGGNIHINTTRELSKGLIKLTIKEL